MVCDEHFIGDEIEPTVAEGIPSTKINRRSFLTASVRSAADRTLDDDLGRAKILLNDFAVSEVEGFEDMLRVTCDFTFLPVAPAVCSVVCFLVFPNGSLKSTFFKHTEFLDGGANTK